MRIRSALALPLLLVAAIDASPSILCPELEGVITKLSKSLTDGYAGYYSGGATAVEFTDSPWRKAKAGAVVLFYMSGWGGGNTNTQILAVFAKNEGGIDERPVPMYRLVAFVEAGEKGRRLVELKGVEGGVINLVSHNYASNDPLCCPSRESTVQFTLNETGLKELGAK